MNRENGFWNYNIIPFKTIRTYIYSNNPLGIENVFGNIIPFIPMGFILGFIFKKNRLKKVFLVSLLIITTFESIQFFACVGYFDIDDIIMNVISSIFGYLICLCLIKKINSIKRKLNIQ